MSTHRIVSREVWLAARKELLVAEKELTRQSDHVARQRQELPWVRIDKEYRFDTEQGRRSLAELFEGRSQLLVYHFMFAPEWKEGCPSCSFVSDHFDGTLSHLAARDVTMVVVSRAPLDKINRFKQQMGWGFNWVSSHGTDFNRDFHVTFTKEEMADGKVYYNYTQEKFPSSEGPGFSVFTKDAEGRIFHTYSSYGRGVEQLMSTYSILDLVPKGRDEDQLPFPMAWVRHHDRYGTNDFADNDRPYWPKVELPAPCCCPSSGPSEPARPRAGK